MASFLVPPHMASGVSKVALNPVVDQYEKCYFEFLSRQQWRRYKCLGDVLDEQLQYKVKVTRCTQTNWNWRKMAERWRHAVLIKPTEVVFVRARNNSISVEALAKEKQQLAVLRRMRSNDKMVDTSDLEYDPYNISSEYNHVAVGAPMKYIPPTMKDTIRSYARQWKLFTKASSNSMSIRHKGLYPKTGVSVQTDSKKSVPNWSTKLPVLRPHRSGGSPRVKRYLNLLL